MQTYIMLGKLTVLALEQARAFGERDANAEEIISKAGGKLISLYYTFGHYDFIATIEAPSEEKMAKILLEIGRFGTFNSETLLALKPEQLYKAASNT